MYFGKYRHIEKEDSKNQRSLVNRIKAENYSAVIIEPYSDMMKVAYYANLSNVFVLYHSHEPSHNLLYNRPTYHSIQESFRSYEHHKQEYLSLQEMLNLRPRFQNLQTLLSQYSKRRYDIIMKNENLWEAITSSNV